MKYRRNLLLLLALLIGFTGSVKKLCAAKKPGYRTVVWCRGLNNHPYYREGIRRDYPQGTIWSRIQPPETVYELTLSARGNLWFTAQRTGNVYFRTGVSPQNPKGTGWKKISNSPAHRGLWQIAAGLNTVWARDRNYKIWFREGISESKPEGTRWVQVDGDASWISVNRKEEVYITRKSDNRICARTGITKDNLKGTGWAGTSGHGGIPFVGTVKGKTHVLNLYRRTAHRQAQKLEGVEASDPEGDYWSNYDSWDWHWISMDDHEDIMWMSYGWRGGHGWQPYILCCKNPGGDGRGWAARGNHWRVDGLAWRVEVGNIIDAGELADQQRYEAQKDLKQKEAQLIQTSKKIDTTSKQLATKNKELGDVLKQAYGLRRELAKLTADEPHTTLWMLDPEYKLHYRDGITDTETRGSAWTPVTSPEGDKKINSFDVGPQGVVWVVTQDQLPRYRRGITLENPRGLEWNLVDADSRLADLSVGPNAVWGVNNQGVVWIREGISLESPQGTKWKKLDEEAPKGVVSGDQLTMISINKLGYVWALSTQKNIYFRDGITKENPYGTEWKKTNGAAIHLSAGVKNNLSWVRVIGTNNRVYERTGITAENQAGTNWTAEVPQPGGKNIVVAVDDKELVSWMIKDDKTMYCSYAGDPKLKEGAIDGKAVNVKVGNIAFEEDVKQDTMINDLQAELKKLQAKNKTLKASVKKLKKQRRQRKRLKKKKRKKKKKKRKLKKKKKKKKKKRKLKKKKRKRGIIKAGERSVSKKKKKRKKRKLKKKKGKKKRKLKKKKGKKKRKAKKRKVKRGSHALSKKIKQKGKAKKRKKKLLGIIKEEIKKGVEKEALEEDYLEDEEEEEEK